MRTPAIALAFALGGCATIIEGTTQEIAMDVVPPHAECSAEQNGKEVARYNPTSRTMFVPKSRRDLIITCAAPGYQTKAVREVSEVSGWGVASILLWDLGLTDYATGALNKYDSSLTIVLVPEDGSAPIVAAPPAIARPAPSPSLSAQSPPVANQSGRYGGGFPPVTSSGGR